MEANLRKYNHPFEEENVLSNCYEKARDLEAKRSIYTYLPKPISGRPSLAFVFVFAVSHGQQSVVRPYLLYLDARTSSAFQEMTGKVGEAQREAQPYQSVSTYRRYDGTELCLSGKTSNSVDCALSSCRRCAFHSCVEKRRGTIKPSYSETGNAYSASSNLAALFSSLCLAESFRGPGLLALSFLRSRPITGVTKLLSKFRPRRQRREVDQPTGGC